MIPNLLENIEDDKERLGETLTTIKQQQTQINSNLPTTQDKIIGLNKSVEELAQAIGKVQKQVKSST